MEDLGRTLLVLVADGTDNTKIKAGQILLHLLPSGNGSIASALVHCATPLLQERLSVIQSTTPQYVEMCEEVRLIAVKIVDVLLVTLGEEIRAHMDAVHCVFAQGCSDPYSEVTVAACDIAFHLCEIFGARLQHVAREFVAEIAPLTCHRQRRVRIVAIKTLGCLMKCGAHEMILELMAFRNPNILSLKEVYGNAPKRNFLGTLATDDCPAVRLAFLEMVGDWLLNLPERLDYASRLLPFILSALTDDIPSVVQRGLELLSLIGDQYQKDHEKELTEKARYLPEEAQGVGWCNFDEFWSTAAAESSLIAPFTARPSLGVRLIVQTNFGAFVEAICADLASSDTLTQQKSLDLLRICLLMAEDLVTHHLTGIIDALLKVLLAHQQPSGMDQRSLAAVDASADRIVRLLKAFADKEILEFTLRMHSHEEEPNLVQALSSLQSIFDRIHSREIVQAGSFPLLIA